MCSRRHPCPAPYKCDRGPRPHGRTLSPYLALCPVAERVLNGWLGSDSICLLLHVTSPCHSVFSLLLPHRRLHLCRPQPLTAPPVDCLLPPSGPASQKTAVTRQPCSPSAPPRCPHGHLGHKPHSNSPAVPTTGRGPTAAKSGTSGPKAGSKIPTPKGGLSKSSSRTYTKR